MAESLLKQMFPQGLYVKSAGARKGELDPFAVAVMAELGQTSPTTSRRLSRSSRLGRAQLRSHHHAVAGGASQGARPDAHARRRCRILADPRSHHDRRQPRPETRRLSRGLRRPVDAHPPPLCQGGCGERVRGCCVHAGPLPSPGSHLSMRSDLSQRERCSFLPQRRQFFEATIKGFVPRL